MKMKFYSVDLQRKHFTMNQDSDDLNHESFMRDTLILRFTDLNERSFYLINMSEYDVSDYGIQAIDMRIRYK